MKQARKILALLLSLILCLSLLPAQAFAEDPEPFEQEELIDTADDPIDDPVDDPTDDPIDDPVADGRPHRRSGG